MKDPNDSSDPNYKLYRTLLAMSKKMLITICKENDVHHIGPKIELVKRIINDGPQIGDSNIREKVFHDCVAIPGVNKKHIGKDLYGNLIHFKDYGQKYSMTGWTIQQYIDNKEGGSPRLFNLQPVACHVSIKLPEKKYKYLM